jgi:hypothetical protein
MLMLYPYTSTNTGGLPRKTNRGPVGTGALSDLLVQWLSAAAPTAAVFAAFDAVGFGQITAAACALAFIAAAGLTALYSAFHRVIAHAELA